MLDEMMGSISLDQFTRHRREHVIIDHSETVEKVVSEFQALNGEHQRLFPRARPDTRASVFEAPASTLNFESDPLPALQNAPEEHSLRIFGKPVRLSSRKKSHIRPSVPEQAALF